MENLDFILLCYAVVALAFGIKLSLEKREIQENRSPEADMVQDEGSFWAIVIMCVLLWPVVLPFAFLKHKPWKKKGGS